MLDLDEKYGTDKGAESEGVWVYVDSEEKSGFKIARMSRSNKQYMKALSKITKRHKRALELETLSDEKAAQIELEVFVDTILKDWKGISANGKELKFSRENALEVMKKYDDLYMFLRAEAESMSSFKKAEMEKSAKN